MGNHVTTNTEIRARLLRDLNRDPGILILAYPYARTWLEIRSDTILEGWKHLESGERGSLYLHVPFCHRKCNFCDFLAYYGRPETEIEQYLELVREEIRLIRSVAGELPLDTIVLGGGTPSLLSPSQIAALLDEITSSLHVAKNAQISMEVFPDSHVTKDWLIGWKAAGINRLSLGIQFLDDALKRMLNRTDTSVENFRILRESRDVGFDDVNIDLMCGLPEQKEDSWLSTISAVIAYKPAHICVFPVSVRHKGIALYHRKETLPVLDRTRGMYNEAVQCLSGSGYQRTTRHNFVRPGFDYRYERMIAELRPLIPLGANSIGYSKDCIYRSHSHLGQYAEAVKAGKLPVHSGHAFLSEERPHNYAVRGIEYLRLDGSDFARQFGTGLRSAFSEQIALLDEFGLAQVDGADLVLTEEGVYFTAAVKRMFFHPSAWERFESMRPDEFRIGRGTLVSSGEIVNQPV